MTKTDLFVVGGFLGAGKTTALLRLAKMLQDEGRRVGLVTNDQAEDLVDTGAIRVRGFRVEEVAGACFCCKFDELADAVGRLRREERPDAILGEPVGSCTDLAATVIAPFRKLYGDDYRVAPYSVLLDPIRARQMVLEKGFGGFSAKVAYVFLKQLEEADVIGLNKVDLLRDAERARLLAALAAEFPKAQVLPLSGLTGEGFAEWRAALAAERAAGRNVAEVDYDVYAEGEAELGWLNLGTEVRGASFDAGALALAIVRHMAGSLAAEGVEIAHLKVLVGTEEEAAIANCVGSPATARLSAPLARPLEAARVIVNARVHVDPESLRATASRTLEAVLAGRGLRATQQRGRWFRPGRPVPTHRYAADEV